MQRSQHTDRYRRLCQLLSEARDTRGFTQAVVAKRLGKPQSYVSKYESGERRLDVIELLDVAAALNISVGMLLNKLK
ncbi:MAG: helix-turn-helix domain-containing protein [Rhizomicrobium sp.]